MTTVSGLGWQLTPPGLGARWILQIAGHSPFSEFSFS